MKAYSIFDDFSKEACSIITHAGIELTIHPLGCPRPDYNQMKHILEEYDCVIIGTSQKMPPEMFENVYTPKIIATASVGLDHIQIPQDKKQFVSIINTPKANAQSVAEYTMACILSCCKRLKEGNKLYREGKNNKALHKKPDDVWGKTIGVIGAGNISLKIMELAQMMGMNVICWTAHPENHPEVVEKGIPFMKLTDLCHISDCISVNLPNKPETCELISEPLVANMKNDAVFVSVSRKQTINVNALIDKAMRNRDFYLCLDLDLDDDIVSKLHDIENILITPHIAGGTIETRMRMFKEIALQLASKI